MKPLTLIAVIFAILLCATAIQSQWSRISSFPNTVTKDIMISGNTVYAATNNGIQKSTDGTATWQTVNNGLNTSQSLSCNSIIMVGDTLYAATNGGIYKSVNFGANWEKKSSGILIGSGAIYEFCESVFEINGVLLAGAYSGIYRSVNGGENWSATNISGQQIKAKNFSLHQGIIYAARESINSPNGYRSSDNGITWSNLDGLSFFNTITFYSEPGKLFAGTIHGAWLSTNNGVNWIQRIAGLSPDPYNSAFIRVNGILITSLKFGGSGMYRSSNDGELWENFDQGLPFLSSIDDLVLFNNNILAAASDGIYQRNISDLTSLSTVTGEIPGDFNLEQNYPNPFNPATKFRFSIPAAAGSGLTALAEVFDITGRQTGILFNSAVEPGTYEGSFDGTGYASGIYFYKLSVYSGGNKLLYSEVKKMSLIK